MADGKRAARSPSACRRALEVMVLAKAGDTERHAADELCIVCSAIAYIEELFERWSDADGIALLRRLGRRVLLTTYEMSDERAVILAD